MGALIAPVLFALSCLVDSAVGLPAVPPYRAAARMRPIRMAEEGKPISLPLRSAVLALLTAESAFGLSRDFPALTTASPDILGTAVDCSIFVYCTSTLLQQAGIVKDDETALTLSGFKCTVTLNIGREPGTWMASEWAASGARLSLPLAVRFSDEVVDLGFPGEEALGGRREARCLICEGGRFVGPQGEVVVNADGGAWASLPTGREGESVVRFFIDFPQEASRNDVSLPAGRVYFSCACWDGGVPLPEELAAEVVEGPAGVQCLGQGGLTIKRNDARNLWGAFGDVMLILGRFSLSTPAEDGDA
uniref:Uncharacterized protein n=1 Tax=Haptolina ericina TaxID=156174 RepID=A0A7S3EZH0_9EUKA|mmetsp:Transcript_40329/g.91334  ORF Transcript_40329/g.91334 Transcript_40329/m.91334 type:complete len:305 (+) Transcript_40329:81-995(+)